MIKLTIITQSAFCQAQQNTWQGSLFSANLTVLMLILVSRWRTNVQWKCLFSILPPDLLPTGDLHKILTDLCLPFRVSWASTWNQLSRLTIVLKTWMILELKPKIPRTLPETFFQCIRNEGLKRTIEKCHFGVRQNELLGRTISSQILSPQTHKVQNFLSKLRFP